MLRKALGSAGEAWIETVPKHGYRFAAAIATIPREQEPANGNSPPMPTTAPSDRKPPRKVQPQQVLPWLVALAGVLMAVALALLYLRQVRNSVPTQGSARFFVSPPEKVMLSDRGLPAVSPNGEQLAFGGIDPDGTSRIWVRPIASLTSEPLPGTEGAHALFWSADSRSIGFFAGGKLKTVQLHGGTPRTLCDASDTVRPLGSWNREGVILFNSFDCRGLFRVPMRGGPVAAVTMLDAARQDVLHLWPQFLPDGHHFIYTVESSIPENTGIYVGSLDGKKSKLVIRASPIANFAQSPSGQGISFTCKEPR